jgi:hypothetical protein
MTNPKKPIFLALLAFATLSSILITTGSSCKEDKSPYILRLDSLDAMLSETAQYLMIDYATITSRKEMIYNQMRYIDQFYTDTMSEEFAHSLSKYKGIRKAYGRFINEYPKAFDEMKELENQAQKLRESVNKDELTKEEFKTYYQQEFMDIDFNRNRAKILAENIHSLEPDYQRISRVMTEELDRIALTNDKLHGYLESLYENIDTTH